MELPPDPPEIQSSEPTNPNTSSGGYQFGVRDLPYKCSLCSDTFRKRKELRKHEEAKHAEQLPLKCELCGHRFDSNDSLKKHVCSKARRKEPTTNESTSRRPSRKKRSVFSDLCWNEETKKWRVMVGGWNVEHYAGEYEKEHDAAHAVNLLCDKIGIHRKNPRLGDPPEYLNEHFRYEIRPMMSKFHGVSFNAQAQKYKTAVYVGVQRYTGFQQKNEKDAAHAVNALCDRFNIPHKNKDIGSPPPNKKLIPELKTKRAQPSIITSPDADLSSPKSKGGNASFEVTFKESE